MEKQKRYHYYIRRYSSTVIAKMEEQKELIGLTAKIPFDDCLHYHASIDDLQIQLIRSFLKKIESRLLESVNSIPSEDLCRQMTIAEGGDEFLKAFLFYLMIIFFHWGLG